VVIHRDIHGLVNMHRGYPWNS